MKKIKINEEITMRGMNNLFYQIEVNDEKGNRLNTISYQRNCVADMLHQTPIFEVFKRMEGKNWNDEQCDECCEKLKKVIKKLEEISKIY